MVSNSETIGVIGFISVALMNGYATYWALGIRRALAVRLYRNQALGIGLVSLGFVGFTFALVVPQWYPSNNDPFFPPFLLLAFITMFYWIDASISAGRRSDPLLRDTFHWRKLRLPLWVVIIGFPLVTIGGNALSPGSTNSIVPWTIILVILIPILSGALVLPVVARRSKDFILRRHLERFALFAFAYLIFLLGGALIGPLGEGTEAGYAYASALSFLGGYFLYRSARSLVPLNRISLDPSHSLKAETSLKPNTSLPGVGWGS